MVDPDRSLAAQRQQRDIPEGSEEWDILYRRYYDEEMSKRQKVLPPGLIPRAEDYRSE